MRVFYFIRHGEAQGGPSRMDRDFELTPLGRRQANALGRRLAKAQLKPKIIFHSALTRARQTAEIIGQHVRAPLHERPDLIEHGSGVLIKKCSIQEASLRCPDQLEPDGKLRCEQGGKKDLHWNFSVGGEDMRALHARGRTAWSRLLELARKDGDYLVVAHGSFLSAMLTEILEMPFRPYWNFSFENCACIRIQMLKRGSAVYPVLHASGPLPVAPKRSKSMARVRCNGTH